MDRILSFTRCSVGVSGASASFCACFHASSLLSGTRTRKPSEVSIRYAVSRLCSLLSILLHPFRRHRRFVDPVQIPASALCSLYVSGNTCFCIDVVLVGWDISIHGLIAVCQHIVQHELHPLCSGDVLLAVVVNDGVQGFLDLIVREAVVVQQHGDPLRRCPLGPPVFIPGLVIAQAKGLPALFCDRELIQQLRRRLAVIPVHLRMVELEGVDPPVSHILAAALVNMLGRVNLIDPSAGIHVHVTLFCQGCELLVGKRGLVHSPPALQGLDHRVRRRRGLRLPPCRLRLILLHLRRPLRGGVLRARGHRLRDLRALRLPVPGGQGGGGFHLSPRLGLRRPACRGVDPSRGADLSAAQDAAHHGAARELLCGGGGVEDGPLVRGGEQGIARPVHGVLQGTLDHALHHFLLALVHHGLHPGLPGALPASQLVRQGLDAASDFHGGVHQAVSNGVQRRLCPHGVLVLRRLVGFADQRRGHFLLRLQLDHVVQSVLVAAAHHLGKGGPVLGVFRHGADGPLYRRRHAGADGLRRCTGQPRRGLRGRAPAAGQQGKDRLGQGGHCAGAQVLKDLGGLSAPRRVGRVMRFNGLLLLPDVRRPSVEKSLVGKGAQVISAQQFKGRKRDILSQREGVSAKPRHLLQTLDHRAFHGLSERIRPLDLPAVFRPPSLPAGVRDSVQILFQRLSRCVRGPGLLAVQAEFPPDFLQCFPLQALRREPGSGSASLLDGVQADQCLPDGVRPAFIGLRPFCAGGSGQGRGGHPALWLCPRRRG